MFSKYGAKKVIYGDKTFDSKKECERYKELEMLEAGGIITDLRTQVSYELVPKQWYEGKLVERSVRYVADFVYYENDKLVVEDTKGVKTPEYIIKRKLMLERYGVRIKEV